MDQTPAIVTTLALERAADFLRRTTDGERHALACELAIQMLTSYADYHATVANIVGRMQEIGIGRGA